MRKQDQPNYHRDRQREYMSTPRGKYTTHKSNARVRGVEFNLTFDEWWSMWEPHWEARGQGGMVMCRTEDVGAYEVGNVRIDTQSVNAQEGMMGNQNASKGEYICQIEHTRV